MPSDFPLTSWTLIRQAAGGEGGTEEGGAGRSGVVAAGRERLLRAYWTPIYVYMRRRGLAHADAEDETQVFCARLLAGEALATADPARGRFRSFLLGALNNHLVDAWRRETAERRDRRRVVEVDGLARERAEAVLRAELGTAEELFDLDWARAEVRAALDDLGEEWARRGRAEHFARLRPQVLGLPGEGDYARAASALGIGDGAVKVEVFRLRRRFRELLRASVATTVASAAELDDELRHLGRLLAATDLDLL
jgi:RNA polymerase sigma factor (sigma-70 family)